MVVFLLNQNFSTIALGEQKRKLEEPGFLTTLRGRAVMADLDSYLQTLI
jgi:hypothetical protein